MDFTFTGIKENRVESNIKENFIDLVHLITTDIRSRASKKQKWAEFKRNNREELASIAGLPEDSGLNPGELIGFDIHPEENLIILNYTSQAHNVLHEIENGWTPFLRAMRGVIFSFGKNRSDIKLVSRSFEKFFNQSELPETSIDNLMARCGDTKLVCREKADGHMVQIFMHNNRVFASTRGKFETLSANQSLEMFNRASWIKCSTIAKSVKQDLMSLIVELITPESEVHVDYKGAKTMFLLASYDTSGKRIHDALLSDIAGEMPSIFSLPSTVMMTLSEVLDDVKDRSVSNAEGWVVDCAGQLVKFKYETYIGMMVAEKLSHKYIMRCMQKNRLQKQLMTLPEEIRETAYDMVSRVEEAVQECFAEDSHLPLYNLYGPLEGGESYYRTVCREFWKEIKN